MERKYFAFCLIGGCWIEVFIYGVEKYIVSVVKLRCAHIIVECTEYI